MDLQERASAYLAKEMKSSRNAFLLMPDILVRQAEKPWAVIDTKWKVLDHREHNLGISSADVYQVLAYTYRYKTDLAVLVYPHRGALGQPGVQRDFLVQGASAGAVCIRVLTVDLASLPGVAAQLQQGVLLGWRDTRAG